MQGPRRADRMRFLSYAVLVSYNDVYLLEPSAGDGKFGLHIWKKPGELLLRKLPDHFRQRFLGPPHA